MIMIINTNASIGHGAIDSVNNPTQKPKYTVQNDSQVVASAIKASETKPTNVVQAIQQTQEVVQKAAEQLQNFVQSMGRDLSFSVDPTTGYHTVTVVNPSTGEVIRQLPTEELIKLAKSMAQLKNVLVSQKA